MRSNTLCDAVLSYGYPLTYNTEVSGINRVRATLCAN